MPTVQALTEYLGGDPVLGYSLLAALFLALVSLAAGLARLDFLVLVRPGVVIQLGVAVLFGSLLAFVGDSLATAVEAAGSEDWLQRLVLPLAAVRRLPLYIMALAYGPTVGLLAAALFAAFETTSAMPGLAEAVFGLELLVIGWLAIYPSPRRQRWAGPFNAIVAYLLAWGTGGLALTQFTNGEIDLSSLWRQHEPMLLGAAISALLLLLISPARYRRTFPASRIATAEPGDTKTVRTLAVSAFDRERRRERSFLPEFALDPETRPSRGQRQLDPPPSFED